MSYIQGKEPKEKGCIFEAGSGKSSDKKNLLLYRDALTVVLLNRFPYANGHLLIAPSRHFSDINEVQNDESTALFGIMKKSVDILRKHLNSDGFNIGLNLGKVAGAGQPDHLHFHVVPRWEGDHNFMTVLDEVRTIPEHIENTFDRLLPDFQKLLYIKGDK
jgi:ATP adenylyltransferase